uniref:Protein NDRG2 n=1 Tax=Takifugu rubripes TaxID=31033 RepID=A0A674NHU5_TAKRU
MTTEMQEIAITEDKPLLTGQADAKDAELAARILLDQGQEHSIETPHGVVHATLHGAGATRRPAILTLHDVGQDSKSCFSTLFKFEEMQEIVKNFTLIHIDTPGQEEGAAAYPAGYQYPSMETIAEMIPTVLQFFNNSVLLSLANPDSVEGLVLINIDIQARGWIDWAAQKVRLSSSCLSIWMSPPLTLRCLPLLRMSANTDLVQSHRDRISKASNLVNIELLWKNYNSRRDLNIDRNSTFKCPVMLVVGDQAPYEDAAVECNSKMDPTTTSFLKMADAGGQPQLTQPAKLTEAFKYFIQGMGYMASSCMTRLSRSRTTSLSSSYSMDGSRSRSRTLSQGSQGGQMPPSPSQTMEVSC